MNGIVLMFAAALVAIPAALAAQLKETPFPSGGAKASDFRPFTPPSAQLVGMPDSASRSPATRPFVVSYPKRNWNIVPGQPPLLVIFAEARNGATVSVERSALRVPYSAGDSFEDFVGGEVRRLQTARPEAEGFESVVRQSADGRLVVVEFVEYSAFGPTRVRQYSIPKGLELYRVICSATRATFSRYDALFEYMAASLRPAATTSK